MKKTNLNLSIVFALSMLFMTLIYSCQNEEEAECQTCNSQNYKIAKVDFMSSQFNFKKYNDTNPKIDLLYLNSNIKQTSKDLINLLDIRGVEINDVLGFNLITNSSEKKASTYVIDKANILGVIFYTRSNNTMIFKFYFKSKNLFKESNLSNLKIANITSNHIFDVDNLFFNDLIISNFLFVDKNYKIIENFNNNSLSNKIDKLYQISNLRSNFRGGCASPCPAENGMECGVDNDDSWFCRPHEDECGEEDQEESLDQSARLNYNLIKIKDDLYNFRDNYLLQNNGGNKIIDDYYSLSKTINIEYHVLDKAVVTFDLLKNDIIPMINSLNNNPKSNSVLINNQLKDKIINYLTEIKPYYSDSESIRKIDNLIAKTNLFSNKTNLYITSNLYLY